MESLPTGCRVKPIGENLCIYAPSMEVFRLLKKSFRSIARLALNNQTIDAIIYPPEGDAPYVIPGYLAFDINNLYDPCATSESELPSPEPATNATETREPISSYAPSRVRTNAGYEEITDFIRGWRAQNLIVTVTSMVSDRCLMVNDLQILDRNGEQGQTWTIENWTGLDFKTLWKDSFMPGRKNYYGDLVSRVSSEHYIPGFEYAIRRPSGALGFYQTDYHYVENFAGVPVRIAISKPGDWRIVENSPDGSEVVA